MLSNYAHQKKIEGVLRQSRNLKKSHSARVMLSKGKKCLFINVYILLEAVVDGR